MLSLHHSAGGGFFVSVDDPSITSFILTKDDNYRFFFYSNRPFREITSIVLSRIVDLYNLDLSPEKLLPASSIHSFVAFSSRKKQKSQSQRRSQAEKIEWLVPA